MTSYVVNNGQTSSGLTLKSGDTLAVNSGGTAVSTLVDAAKCEPVSVCFLFGGFNREF